MFQKIKQKKIIERMHKAYDSFAVEMRKLMIESENLYKNHLKKVETEKIAETLAQIKKIVKK